MLTFLGSSDSDFFMLLIVFNACVPVAVTFISLFFPFSCSNFLFTSSTSFLACFPSAFIFVVTSAGISFKLPFIFFIAFPVLSSTSAVICNLILSLANTNSPLCIYKNSPATLYGKTIIHASYQVSFELSCHRQTNLRYLA